MPKKKTQRKKKKVPKKKAQKKKFKKRSQKVNRRKYVEPEVLFKSQKENKAESKKVICFNMECKLRRAGCYGYEACPGFKVKG